MSSQETQQWLIPVDESPSAAKVLAWIEAHRHEWTSPPTVHFLNVQPQLSNDVGRFVNETQLNDFFREEGQKILMPIEKMAREQGLNCVSHITMGHSAERIVEFAQSLNCSMILMSTRGYSGVMGTLMGSVSAKVAATSKTPLLLING